MKKIFFLTIIALIGFPVISLLHAQQQDGNLRERLERKQQTQQGVSVNNRQLTVRAQLKNQSQTNDIANVTWKREIYRRLNMEKDINAALYYPVKPMGDRINLSTLIFNKVISGEITAYKYVQGGSEYLSKEYILPIDSSFFLNIEIPFEVVNGKYIVSPEFVPSEEVREYYVKEIWYFDKNNSVVDVQIEAICPIMIFQGYDTGMENHPLYWVTYESIRPYISQMPIMVSSLNNASTQTINDFFVKRNYDGEIYKTTNMRNLTLNEQFTQPDSLKKEQKKIEKQLQDFKNNLWVYNDSIDYSQRQVVAKTGVKSKEKGEDSNKKEVKRKESKQQTSSATRSMRNRKRN